MAQWRLLLAHFQRAPLVTLSALSPLIPKPSLPAPVDHPLKTTLLLTMQLMLVLLQQLWLILQLTLSGYTDLLKHHLHHLFDDLLDQQ